MMAHLRSVPELFRIGFASAVPTTAAWALEPSRTLFSKTWRRPASAARCTRGSKVVNTSTSSVVDRVRNCGPEDITQSANSPPALAAAARDRTAGCARASAAWRAVR